MPNGVNSSWVADLTFHVDVGGTYKPKVTFFADNAPTSSKTATLVVTP